MGKKSNKYVQHPFNGYVDYDPSEDVRRLIKSTEFDLDKADITIINFTQAKYKVSFREDTYNNCYNCQVMCLDPDSPNYGWVLVGRGSSPIKSLKQAAYLHWVEFDRTWPKEDGGQSAKEYDD